MINKIAIVVPCYNEEKRLHFNSVLAEVILFPQIDFLFVNDGSIDKTSEILDALTNSKENIKTFNLKRNLGKAEAVRCGILELLNGTYYTHVGYLDADLATPISQLEIFLDHLRNDRKYQILFGSRIKRAGAKIERNQLRHYAGRVMATIVNNSIIKIPVYDTQCGAKLMTAALAREIFKEPFVSRWMFDIELIARLQISYPLKEVLEIVYEVPLTEWIEKGNTRIRFRDIVQIPSQLIKIYIKYGCAKFQKDFQ